jgi:calcium-dependent protein kinase
MNAEKIKIPEQIIVAAPKSTISSNEFSKRNLNDFYDIEEEKILGTGLNGIVKACIHRQTKSQFALKRLSKKELKTEKLVQLRVEIDIMIRLNHPNILRLHEFFETEEELLLILELCTGGELIDRLNEQINQKFSEPVACRLVLTMLNAIQYCHSNFVIHRDLKLENFLFENRGDDAQLKLIDFGLSQYFKPGQMLHKALGIYVNMHTPPFCKIKHKKSHFLTVLFDLIHLHKYNRDPLLCQS